MTPLRLFYAEPDPDRWLPLDRYPRRVMRRVLRGRPRPGGQMRVFLNLRAGLDRLGVSYTVNDYSGARNSPDQPVGIIGKPFLLKRAWRNPILFGAAIPSHPVEIPGLLDGLAVPRVLTPGPWNTAMFRPYWGDRVVTWPVGIDVEFWRPDSTQPDTDVLLYDKVMWDRDHFENSPIEPVKTALRALGLTFRTIRYGAYNVDDYRTALAQCRAMVFLCEHETQGIAYQEALASGKPILAWDRGGEWRDPYFWPEKVRFGPVSSVPYFDERCGLTFANAEEFPEKLCQFWDNVLGNRYAPRDYILENLTLETCARTYLGHLQEIA